MAGAGEDGAGRREERTAIGARPRRLDQSYQLAKVRGNRCELPLPGSGEVALNS